MRKLPRNGTLGRRLGGKRRFHRWLAAWLQDRRRKRRFATGDPLEVGLVQFFDVVAGATHLKSWNETEPVPDNPLGAMGAVTKVAGSAYPVAGGVRACGHERRNEAGTKPLLASQADDRSLLGLRTRRAGIPPHSEEGRTEGEVRVRAGRGVEKCVGGCVGFFSPCFSLFALFQKMGTRKGEVQIRQ